MSKSVELRGISSSLSSFASTHWNPWLAWVLDKIWFSGQHFGRQGQSQSVFSCNWILIKKHLKDKKRVSYLTCFKTIRDTFWFMCFIQSVQLSSYSKSEQIIQGEQYESTTKHFWRLYCNLENEFFLTIFFSALLIGRPHTHTQNKTFKRG